MTTSSGSDSNRVLDALDRQIAESDLKAGRRTEDGERILEEIRAQGEQDLIQFKDELAEYLQQVLPTCHGCDQGNIQIRTSSHLIDVGNVVIGPGGRGPSFSTHVDFLYCENCGQVYYTKSWIEKVSELLAKIADAEKRSRTSIWDFIRRY